MENTIILGSGQKIEVLFQDEVSLDIDCALRYIESGQKEIAAYVQNTAKPQLDGVITQAETDMAVQIAKGVADAASTASAAAAETINNSIDNANAQIEAYVAANITPDLDAALASAEEYASSAETTVNGFDEHAAALTQQVAASAASALASQTAASASAAAAEESADSALEAANKASFGNIGDIQYTCRTEVPNGGAWCDGAEYTQAAFPDIYQMLVDGKLQKTDYETFNSSVSTNGCCGFFALNTETTSFKVPLLKDVYIKAGQTPADFGAESLPNIKGLANQDGINADLGHGLVGWGIDQGAFYESSETTQAAVYSESGARQVMKLGFDASLSSSTYQDEAKVNPDHVIYKAYVVLASAKAESSTEVVNYQLYNTVPLLTPIFHPEEIVDANWLKSAGQWNDGSVYEAVYNELTEDYATGTNEEDTIDGITISYRLTAKKRRICMPDQITNITDLFAATGIAWYYVLDTANTQFRLPQSKYGFVGSRNNVGGYVKESLPNITGSCEVFSGAGTPAATGALISEEQSLSVVGQTPTGSTLKGFDASRASSVYQDGAPVQERAIEAYLYFKVGNTTENAQTINVGIITNTLAGKADTDLNNVTAAGKKSVVDWVMPDYSAGIAVNNATYTAPSKGWVYVGIQGGNISVSVNGTRQQFAQPSLPNSYNATLTLPYMVDANDEITITGYSAGLNTPLITFYPIKGANQNA